MEGLEHSVNYPIDLVFGVFNVGEYSIEGAENQYLYQPILDIPRKMRYNTMIMRILEIF